MSQRLNLAARGLKPTLQLAILCKRRPPDVGGADIVYRATCDRDNRASTKLNVLRQQRAGLRIILCHTVAIQVVDHVDGDALAQQGGLSDTCA
jgi:hypothetical protein